jgi:D-alanyl-D-alanine carboxypeptidase
MSLHARVAATLALIFCISGCMTLPAQTKSHNANRPHPELQAIISSDPRLNTFSGVILVADQNEIIFEQAFNETTLGDSYQVDLDTPFPVASITKSFTAILVLQFAQRDLLDLDDPIAVYLPQFSAPYAERVRVRDLLQNRSGLPNYTELPGWFDASYKRSLSPDVLLSEIASLPLKFEPGADYLYSNANFYLLGRIVEEVAEKPYATILSDNILVPLDLDQTGQIFGARKSSSMAKNAVREEDGTYTHIPIINPRIFKATASISTTVRDLFYWQESLRDETLLQAEMKSLLFDPNRPMGWTVGEVPISAAEELLIQTYNGELLGYTSMVTRFPEKDGAVIILNNNNAGYDMLAELTLEIATELYGR